MNWMGGARYRIKTQGERKLQKEFFDRKRFGALRSACSRTGSNKGISQDLLALQTVNRHSKNKQDGVEQQKAIKNVDLDKFRSCTRSIDEVDLGPMSPTPAASRLLLMEPKTDPNQTGSGQGSHIFKTNTSNIDFTPQKDDFDSFLKPASVPRQLQRSNGSSKQQNKSTIILESKITPGDYISTGTKDKIKSQSQLLPFSFQKHKKPHSSTFDPFASEDFQITPLTKYSKQDLPEAPNFGSKRKRHRSAFDITEIDPKHSRKTHHDSCSTSTPLKDSEKRKFHHKHKHKFDFTFFSSNLSPIEKLPKLPKHKVPELEDDFIYKPRQMVLTPDSSAIRNSTPVFDSSSIIASSAELKPNKEFSKSSESSFSWEKSNFGNHSSDIFRTKSVLENNQASEASGKNYLEQVVKSNVFLRNSAEDPIGTIFKETGSFSEITPEMNNRTTFSGNSSLSRYRQTLQESENDLHSSFNHEKDLQKRLADKSDGIRGNDDQYKADFQYRPFRRTPPEEGKTVDIMKLYQKHTETNELDSNIYKSHTVSSERMPRGDDAAILLRDTGITRPLNGGEARKFTRSPEVAEEYPAHLLQQSAGSFGAGFSHKRESPVGLKNAPGTVCTEIDEWSTPGVNKANRTTKKECKSPMEELLQEMKDLEQQDTAMIDEAAQEASYNDQNQLTSHEQSTEQSEVDHFLDSEQKFWANTPTPDKPVSGQKLADSQEKENTNSETLKHNDQESLQKNEIATTKAKNFVEDKVITDDSEKWIAEQYYMSSILMDLAVVTDNTHTEIDKASDANSIALTLRESFPEKSAINSDATKNSDQTKFETECFGEKTNQNEGNNKELNISVHENEDKIEIQEETKQKNDLNLRKMQLTNAVVKAYTNKISSLQTQSQKQATEKNIMQKNHSIADKTELVPCSGEIGARLKFLLAEVETKPNVKVRNKRDVAEPDDQVTGENYKFINSGSIKNIESAAAKGTCSKYFSKLRIGQKTETDIIQDPQVSSGCNQETQTDSVPSIDVASSPFIVHHSPVLTRSVGIQCNVESPNKRSINTMESKVPKLGLLTSCFLSESCKKSITFVSYLRKNLSQPSNEPTELGKDMERKTEVDDKIENTGRQCYEIGQLSNESAQTEVALSTSNSQNDDVKLAYSDTQNNGIVIKSKLGIQDESSIKVANKENQDGCYTKIANTDNQKNNDEGDYINSQEDDLKSTKSDDEDSQSYDTADSVVDGVEETACVSSDS